ncbi:MAG TPA: hypothetical protein VFF73_35475 [Planctomycetota bacterium]|nr:hypothetical protein [Planctomycetota bacterium]
MSDDRLREAERVYRETGDVSAETRLLLERVRAGVLAKERLELAATLRYEPAVLALGGPTGPRSHSVRGLLAELERFGTEVVVRAALVMAKRSAAQRPEDEATASALAAVEAWLPCPCPAHLEALEAIRQGRINVHARFAVGLALGQRRDARAELLLAELMLVRHAPEPPSATVEAIRRTLTAWALAPGPHEPRRRPRPDRGSVLELLIGGGASRETRRLLVAADRTTIGGEPGSGIQLEQVRTGGATIIRSAGGFDLEADLGRRAAWIDDEPVSRHRLATGDVLGIDHAWAEVRLHEAPFEDEIATALADAEWIGERLHSELTRLEIAALAGHLGAGLAAARAGIILRPRLGLQRWIDALPDLPGAAAGAATLALAREVRAHWTEAPSGDAVLDGALDALAAWLEAPSADQRTVVELRGQDLEALLRRLWAAKGHGTNWPWRTEWPTPVNTFPPGEPGLAAGFVALAAVRSGVTNQDLSIAAQRAIDANLGPERVRALVADQLVRWALRP